MQQGKQQFLIVGRGTLANARCDLVGKLGVKTSDVSGHEDSQRGGEKTNPQIISFVDDSFGVRPDFANSSSAPHIRGCVRQLPRSTCAIPNSQNYFQDSLANSLA